MKWESRTIAAGGMIAAVYTVLTLICSSIGLASGVIQFRFSEALCVLPFFTPAAVPGLFIGCLISNLITGCPVWDVVFGSLASLLGAVGTRLLRRHRLLGCLPPVLANAVIIPPILVYTYGVDQSLWFLALTVAAGEILSVLLPGQMLYSVLKRYPGLLQPY